MLDLNNKIIYLIVGVIVVVALILLYPKLFATKEVKVYFSDQQAQYLVPQVDEVKVNNLYSNMINQLIEGPVTAGLEDTIPKGTELIRVEIENRVATVNFNRKLQDNHWGGSTGEIMTVYSIVNTLTALDEIDKVQILIEDKKITTLAGHLSLEEPLSFNQNLINE